MQTASQHALKFRSYSGSSRCPQLHSILRTGVESPSSTEFTCFDRGTLLYGIVVYTPLQKMQGVASALKGKHRVTPLPKQRPGWTLPLHSVGATPCPALHACPTATSWLTFKAPHERAVLHNLCMRSWNQQVIHGGWSVTLIGHSRSLSFGTM